jgi:hypothetical protein
MDTEDVDMVGDVPEVGQVMVEFATETGKLSHTPKEKIQDQELNVTIFR